MEQGEMMDKFIEFFVSLSGLLLTLQLSQCLHKSREKAAFLVSLIFSLAGEILCICCMKLVAIDIIKWNELIVALCCSVLAWSSVSCRRATWWICLAKVSRHIIKIRNYKHVRYLRSCCVFSCKNENSISWNMLRNCSGNMRNVIKNMESAESLL